MGVFEMFFLVCALATTGANVFEKYFQDNRQLAKILVDVLQDPRFNQEVLFDLKKENQIYLNRTISFTVKYIIKREVDNYRTRRTDAISRKIYSAIIMKLIDIAKDLPRNSSATNRIETAHRYFMTVDNQDVQDHMADLQVFHACARLYDVLSTAPKFIAHLGNLDNLTPSLLVRKMKEIDVKPIHLGAALLIQYHLRSTVNFAIKSRTVEVLSTRPQMVGAQVIEMLKALASHLLPVAELLDVHVAHYSSAFKDTSPATWLGIVSNKRA